MEKTDYVHKAINGTVITVEDRQTTAGKYLAKARIRSDDGKIWCCTFWDDQATAFMARGMLNQKIYVEGGIREENTIGVKFFDGKPAPGGQLCASKKITDEDRKEYKSHLDKVGRVIVPYDDNGIIRYCARNKRHCVKVNGAWELKIDYCLRIMGPTEVLGWLREFKSDGSPGGVLVTPDKYKEKLELMLEASQRYAGDYLESSEAS